MPSLANRSSSRLRAACNREPLRAGALPTSTIAPLLFACHRGCANANLSCRPGSAALAAAVTAAAVGEAAAGHRMPPDVPEQSQAIGVVGVAYKGQGAQQARVGAPPHEGCLSRGVCSWADRRLSSQPHFTQTVRRAPSQPTARAAKVARASKRRRFPRAGCQLPTHQGPALSSLAARRRLAGPPLAGGPQPAPCSSQGAPRARRPATRQQPQWRQ